MEETIRSTKEDKQLLNPFLNRRKNNAGRHVLWEHFLPIEQFYQNLLRVYYLYILKYISLLLFFNISIFVCEENRGD